MQTERIGRAVLHCGDAVEAMRQMAAEGVRVDSIVTDPPYHLASIVKRFGAPGAAAPAPGVYGRAARGFMGKAWDGGDIAFRPETWRAAFDLLPPGGHLIAFSGTRTYHRMACAIEDAGFEIRDQIGWLYGSGFPKSHDVAKGIAKAAPATPEAAGWAGWGTALKPAWESIVLARKPLAGTVAANVQAHGAGALNIDGCRIEGAESTRRHRLGSESPTGWGGSLQNACETGSDLGRWPANVIHDGSPEVEAAFAAFGERTSGSKAGGQYERSAGIHEGGQRADGTACYAAGVSVSRFFYAAKATKAERGGSAHPTVKPLALMAYLCRLVTRPGGVVLDPFAGTGTTMAAALLGGFGAIGIELEAEYQADIRRRLAAITGEAAAPIPAEARARQAPAPQPDLFAAAPAA